MAMDDERNLNDLDQNMSNNNSENDISNALSEDITSKIANLNNELNSIIFDIQNTNEKQENINNHNSTVSSGTKVKKDQEDIEELINIVLEQTTVKKDKPVEEKQTKEKPSKEPRLDDTQEIVDTISDILGDDVKVKVKKEIVDKTETGKEEKKIEITTNVTKPIKPIKLTPVTKKDKATGNTTNKTKKKKSKKKKENARPQGKKSTFAWAVAMCAVLFMCVCLGSFAIYFTKNMCKGIPEFTPAALDSADSSIVYDVEGNQIMELGLYLRENVEYDDIPNCVIDSFVSIEDSRFFGHFGFDIPRFTKAIISNLRTLSFGQGGSTLTMQLVKLSYFQVDNDEDSTMAARSGMSGVQRKVQEIILSLQAEQQLSKKEIICLYLNKVNFGDNIRGIQKAAEYYFGKDVRELNLNEAAFLAGIVNAPNGNNPYNSIVYEDTGYLDAANARKNEVLDLMVYHGYITEEEAALNKNVMIENLVTGKEAKFKETNPYYQSFIDAVINEAYEVTGKSPYTTAMNIYTSMDPTLQEYVYNMQNNPEMFADKYEFRHENQQNALVVLNNQTGELVALGGGRNQADEARQFNRAVDAYINPGSSIKPVLEYALAFDRLGYATSHTICDKPVFLYETDIAVANAYGQGYTGDMQLTEALARSLNTPAIQLMDELLDYYEEDPNYEKPEDAIIEYCRSIGLDYCNKNTFDVQWAIGGRDCLVTPVQLAGAHAMLMHDGKYITPHTIKRIEYRGKYNEVPDFVADTEGTRVLSSAAAYMTAYLERNNVTSGWISQLNLLRRDYATYAKTGTTNFSEAAYINYRIPETGAKDQWLCTQTSNYTIVVWNGFDKLEDNAYFTVNDENYNLKCKMGSLLLDAVMNHYNYDAHDVEKSDDVVEIKHLLGCFPYAYGDSATGYISKDSPYVNLVDESTIVKPIVGGILYHMGAVESAEGVYVHWDEFNAYLEEGRVDTSITSVSGNKTVIATGRSYYPRYNFVNPGAFHATVTAASGESFSVDSSTPTALVEVSGEGPFTVCGWTDANPNPVCGSSRHSK